MELNEMKTAWGEMSAALNKQKKLTGSLIIKMTEVKYREKINKIWLSEVAGAAVCLASLLYILFNLEKLNTGYLQVFGIVAMLILILLPTLSIRAVCMMRSVNISASSYAETLAAYAKGKIQFVRAQKLSFYLGGILLLLVLPVMAVLMGAKGPFKRTAIWYIYVLLYPFFYLFAKWSFKNYMNTAGSAENILKELSEQ